MNIAIVDDEKNIRLYIRKLIEKQGGEHAVKEYSSGNELISDVKSDDGTGLDIIFLDIAMDDTDGMKAAEALRHIQAVNGVSAWGSLPLIIFVTGLSGYMQKAFSVSAFRYMLKPVDENEFEKIFREAGEEVLSIRGKQERSGKKITVGNGADTHTVRARDIVYIESSGHKNLIYLDRLQLQYYGNLIDLEKELVPDYFRVHRGYLVNLLRVDHYDRQDVYMDNGDRIPVSRYKYQEFVKTYLEYIRR